MKDLLAELQGSLGRVLTDRETRGLHQLVEEHGMPTEIKVGDPWFKGDDRRPMGLAWLIDGELRWVSFAPSAPPEKPRNLVREHFEQYAGKHGGVLITEEHRIGLDGRRTIDRRARRFPTPKGCRPDAPLDPAHVRPQTRARGAGRPRAQATRSSAKSGDSGSEGECSEPPGADGRRLCVCPCRRDISHKRAEAHYFDPEACRKRYQRERDRAHPDRVVARKLKRLAAADGLERLVADELPRGCRCPGEGFERDPEGVPVCIACGRPVTVGVRSVNGYDAHLAEVRGWMRNDRVESRQVHRRHRPRDWRTRPTRGLSAKLRKTRKAAA